MPAGEWSGGNSKGSTRVEYHGFATSVSDSEVDGRSCDYSHYFEDMNTYHNTRLKQELFDWLQDWCVQNSDRIERRRALESKKSLSTRDKLAEDLRVVEGGIRKSYKTLAEQKKKKRHLKRRLIVLADETPVVTTNESILKRKLYTFCSIMALPLRNFDCSQFPTFDEEVLKERDAVR